MTSICKLPVWARHVPASVFCYVPAISGGSAVTLCNGRWPEHDEVTIATNPPYDERCDACQAGRIEMLRVDVGLEELARLEPTFHVNPWAEWPGVCELAESDLIECGGEA